MKVINPFQINNWSIKKFLIIIFSFHLLFWGSIAIDFIGLNIPLLRQIICSLYLSFIPGMVILRTLRLHKLDDIQVLLYTVGLSLFSLMFVGFFTNIIFPIVGMEKPISTFTLELTISTITLFFSIICYSIDKDFENISFFDLTNIFSSPCLFLCLLPILTIIGTYLMNFYDNNYLLMAIIFLITVIIIFVYFDYIPNQLYPLAIFVIALSLLFHTSLISMYLVGWDIQLESYIANSVITSSIWNPSMYYNTNAMLSIAFLAPIYSILGNVSIIWVFKIIYPIIFSFVPVGMYKIFQTQTNNKIAFMSVFFFISFYVFYTEMLQLARQEIAEFFLILLLLLIIQSEHSVSNSILSILFSFSIIVSHYGLSYILMGSIICSLFIKYASSRYFKNILNNDIHKININFTLLFCTFLFSWYIYTSNSSILNRIVYIVDSMSQNFISDFLNPDRAQGLSIILKKPTSYLHNLFKYMNLFAQLCISIGLLRTIKQRQSFKFKDEYLFMSIIFYILLLAAIAVPDFSNVLNTSRLYQITLILLSPFCVIGGITISKLLLTNISLFNIRDCNKFSLGVITIFFSLFFLFNTGWIYEIAGDSPTSYSLNNTIDFPKFNDMDVDGNKWLYQVTDIKNNNGYLYGDYNRWLLFRTLFGNDYLKIYPAYSDQLSKNSYFYFSTYNIFNNKILIRPDNNENSPLEYVNLDPYISSKNKIYNNGGANIYYQ